MIKRQVIIHSGVQYTFSKPEFIRTCKLIVKRAIKYRISFCCFAADMKKTYQMNDTSHIWLRNFEFEWLYRICVNWCQIEIWGYTFVKNLPLEKPVLICPNFLKNNCVFFNLDNQRVLNDVESQAFLRSYDSGEEERRPRESLAL
jgi:hypothetical protein